MAGGHDAVTGAFGYVGRAIATELLSQHRSVLTLTNHPRAQDPLAARMRVAPLSLRAPSDLARALEGTDTLYNTYWVRFPRRSVSFERAVSETLVLFAAAREAGVRRVVQISVTNAAPGDPLPYFRGKADIDAALRASGGSYAIVRPTVVFGGRDVLLNNIAWLLRRLPVVGVAGDGRYRVQPVCVDDVGRIAVEAGRRDDAVDVDAAGPEQFTYLELVHLLRAAVGSRARIVHVPSSVVLLASAVLGRVVRDEVLTRDELAGLMAGKLVSRATPTGRVRLTDWLAAHADEAGREWANELERHYGQPRGRLAAAGAG